MAAAAVASEPAAQQAALKRTYSSMWIGEDLADDYGVDTSSPPKNRRAGVAPRACQQSLWSTPHALPNTRERVDKRCLYMPRSHVLVRSLTSASACVQSDLAVIGYGVQALSSTRRHCRGRLGLGRLARRHSAWSTGWSRPASPSGRCYNAPTTCDSPSAPTLFPSALMSSACMQACMR